MTRRGWKLAGNRRSIARISRLISFPGNGRQGNAALRRDHLINFAGYAANEIVDYRSLIKPLFLDGN
jgi:hypothetical protein